MTVENSLQNKRSGIIKEIAALGAMRKGSLCEQYQSTRRKDGTTTKRGPYVMYTFKRGTKTFGKRLSRSQAPLYREQIEKFRKFQILCGDLADVSEKMADHQAAEREEGKKNSSKASGRKRRRKLPGSLRR